MEHSLSSSSLSSFFALFATTLSGHVLYVSVATIIVQGNLTRQSRARLSALSTHVDGQTTQMLQAQDKGNGLPFFFVHGALRPQKP